MVLEPEGLKMDPWGTVYIIAEVMVLYIEGKNPYTILNGCVGHNDTRVWSSRGCYAKACPESCDEATVSIVRGIQIN